MQITLSRRKAIAAGLALAAALAATIAGVGKLKTSRAEAGEIKDKRFATFRIAASDAPKAIQKDADLVCDGIDDEVEIHRARDVLWPQGGVIELAPKGNFHIGNRSGRGITLSGVGLQHNEGMIILKGTGVVRNELLDDSGLLHSWVTNGYCINSNASTTDRHAGIENLSIINRVDDAVPGVRGGIRWHQTSRSSYCRDVSIRKFAGGSAAVNNAGSAGIRVSGSSFGYFLNVVATGCQYGVLLQTEAPNFSINFQRFMLCGFQSNGINVGIHGTMTGVEFFMCEIEGAVQREVLAKNVAINGLRIHSCHIEARPTRYVMEIGSGQPGEYVRSLVIEDNYILAGESENQTLIQINQCDSARIGGNEFRGMAGEAIRLEQKAAEVTILPNDLTSFDGSYLSDLRVVVRSDVEVLDPKAGGGVRIPRGRFRVTRANNFTLSATDEGILSDAFTGPKTMRLPGAAAYKLDSFIVKKIDATANPVTVMAQSGESIDGASSYEIAAQWSFVEVVSDGVNWFVVARG